MRRTPLKRRTPLRSHSHLAPIGRKARREADDLAAFRAVVHDRLWCEGNDITCSAQRHNGHHAHHIWPGDRDMGLHDPERGLLLCAAAHHYVHANPSWSYLHGYLGRTS